MVPDAAIRDHLDRLLKPPGSLGRLEMLAAFLCRRQQTLQPITTPRAVVLFAGDHGSTAAGVSLWPSELSARIVTAVLDGKAASAVLAQQTNTPLRVVDVGLIGAELPAHPLLRTCRIRAGARNLAEEPALTVEEFRHAQSIGAQEAQRCASVGCRVVIGGEIGIGNSTSAAATASLLTGIPPSEAVGRGAGANEASLERKRLVVRVGVERAVGELTTEPIRACAAVAGLEIAALAGFYQRAAELGLTILLDGYIASTAALIAERLAPGTSSALIAAHRSAEPGHTAVLRTLGLTPLLDGWQMCLGEGTGALTALPLLDAAATIVGRMGTLDDLRPPGE